MTTINIAGKITAVEVDEAPEFDIISLSCGTLNIHPRITIDPSGAKVTVILASSNQLPGTSPSGFQLSADFNVGDVVEVYNDNAPLTGSPGGIFDENGHDITPGHFDTSGLGIICRKVATGTGRTWVRTFA